MGTVISMKSKAVVEDKPPIPRKRVLDRDSAILGVIKGATKMLLTFGMSYLEIGHLFCAVGEQYLSRKPKGAA